MKRIMSKELSSLAIKADKGIAIDSKKINYAYALLAKNDSRIINLSLDEYNKNLFPKMKDGRYILVVNNLNIGIIEYKDGKISSKLPKYLIRLEWLEDPIIFHTTS